MNQTASRIWQASSLFESASSNKQKINTYMGQQLQQEKHNRRRVEKDFFKSFQIFFWWDKDNVCVTEQDGVAGVPLFGYGPAAGVYILCIHAASEKWNVYVKML